MSRNDKSSFPSILQINRSDRRGGAAQVAWNLFTTYRQWGHSSWMAVDIKLTNDPNVFVFPNDATRGPWYQFWKRVQDRARSANKQLPGLWRFSQIVGVVASPIKSFKYYLGREDFYYPGSRILPQMLPGPPDVIHGHVLHGGFFDLNYLNVWGQNTPVFLTLHDAWLLSGHCAHSFDCNRWQHGCGSCPDLSIPPAIQRDATAYNWRQKYNIYRRSRYYVATPSQWLMNKVQQSMLMAGAVECKVIPNGIDHSIFQPTEQSATRLALGLPPTARIVMFSANGIRRNIWKDYATFRCVMEEAANQVEGKLLFIALGETAEPEQVGQAEIRFIPYEADPRVVAQYYQAADVYLHAARVDTFPNAVLEALSCGVPVVGSAVGGIPEQIKGWRQDGVSDPLNSYPLEQATGVLVPPGDVEAMTSAVVAVLSDRNWLTRLGQNAAEDAHHRFNLNTQAQIYLDWYQEVLKRDAKFFNR